MSSGSLPKNSISIGLTIRYPVDDTDPDNYHWLMWLVAGDLVNGKCVHANNASGAFVFQEKPWNAATSQSLAALVQIGTLNDTNTIESVTALLKAIKMASPKGTEDENIKFSCRIWIREAVRVLNRHGVIACADVNALEKECDTYASKNRQAVETGKGKASFHVSAVSK